MEPSGSPVRGLILFLLFGAAHAGRGLWKIQERVRSVRLQNAKQLLLEQKEWPRLGRVKEGEIHQPLDHFNPQDLRTFPQVRTHPKH